jgi:ribose transport system ATP-binding protein
MGILLISSELPEIIGMSDRILVMRDNRIAGEFSRHEFSEQTIGSCAIASRKGHQDSRYDGNWPKLV